jgi:hypothetical protein
MICEQMHNIVYMNIRPTPTFPTTLPEAVPPSLAVLRTIVPFDVVRCAIVSSEFWRQFMEVQGAKGVEMRKQVFVFFGNWTRRHPRVDSAPESKLERCLLII